jgi:hypothetical protein
MSAVPDISGLAETPRMLSFITDQISDDELRDARTRAEHITAGGLCERLIEKWLSSESDIAETKGSRPGLGRRGRLALAERLALWVRVDRAVSSSRLVDLIAEVLPEEGGRWRVRLRASSPRKHLQRF